VSYSVEAMFRWLRIELICEYPTTPTPTLNNLTIDTSVVPQDKDEISITFVPIQARYVARFTIQYFTVSYINSDVPPRCPCPTPKRHESIACARPSFKSVQLPTHLDTQTISTSFLSLPCSSTTASTPLPPNRATTPSFNPNRLSICAGVLPCKSRIKSACLISNTSKNSLPCEPLPNRSSTSALACSRARASSTAIAGFFLGSGAAAPVELDGWPKAEEGERVGLGCTGPRERRERAKSGSEASRLMASERVPAARGWGLTVGPAEWSGAGGG